MKRQVFNPFLPLNTYIPDGEPHVFGDRVYLFGSHDKETGETFCMLDYEGWSAPVEDLSDWSSAGSIYSAKQDPKYDAVSMPYIFAPDVVQGNDGRFYMYYCLAGKDGAGGYSNPVSVAVCDTPNGKYEFYGHVKDKSGKPLMKYVCFDPGVMNDNGTIRLYYGANFPFDEYRNFLSNPILDKVAANILGHSIKEIKEMRKAGDSIIGTFHVELEDDMLTAKTKPVRILPSDTRGTDFAGHAFFEASSIRKIDDIYYFIYSSQNNHELCYATSKYPDRNYQFGGTIVSNGDVGYHGRKPENRLNNTGTNHGSIVCIKDQWYVFYHRLTHLSDFSRQAMAQPIQILQDRSIPQVEMTSCGLNGGPLLEEGRYPAVIACNLTNGKMPHGKNKKKNKLVPCVSSGNGQQFIRDISGGTLIGYKYFDFSGGDYTIKVRTRGEAFGTLWICLNSEITDKTEWENKIEKMNCGKITVSRSKEWKVQNTSCKINKGIMPLYFVYCGKGALQLLEFEIIKER